MPPALCIGNFISHYGHDAWLNPHHDTSDHIVPFKRFLLMYGMIPNVQAYQRLSDTHAHFHALAMLNCTDKTAIRKIADLEFATAYGTK